MPKIDLKKNTNFREYNHRIDIVRDVQSQTPNDMGIVTMTEEIIYSPKAKISHMSAKDYTRQQVTPYSREVMRFWFRTHPKVKVTCKDFVRYDGKKWNIRTADDLNDNGRITYLDCEVCE